jgi:hypothetical protein
VVDNKEFEDQGGDALDDLVAQNLVSRRSSENAKPGPNAARFKINIMNEKRYRPIVSPITTCIAQAMSSQASRVFFHQMKPGYVISINQTTTPSVGRKCFHLTKISGATTL